MKVRQFNKLLKTITTKGKLDVSKIPNLSYEERAGMVQFLAKKRHAIPKELIPYGYDHSWLNTCGYLYSRKTDEHTFIHCGDSLVRAGRVLG